MTKYKKLYPFDKRVEEFIKIKEKYPDMIPCIIETQSKVTFMKNKYLLPKDLQLGHLIYIIRKKIHLSQYQSIFVFVNDKLMPSSNLIIDIYNLYKDNDGFLYIMFALENTFG